MKVSELSLNWPKSIALLIMTGLLFWGFNCQPKVTSLIDPQKKITRPELQIELDSIIATAEFRLASLDDQQQFRDIIFKNAMVMVEAGTLNPIGIITMLAGLYGITRGVKDAKDKVITKRKTNNNTG